MSASDERPDAAPAQPQPRKRPYVPPRLETFGSIHDLTRGPTSREYLDDGEHPPGHNKSRTP